MNTEENEKTELVNDITLRSEAEQTPLPPASPAPQPEAPPILNEPNKIEIGYTTRPFDYTPNSKVVQAGWNYAYLLVFCLVIVPILACVLSIFIIRH